MHENKKRPHATRRQRPMQAATETIGNHTRLGGSSCCASFQHAHAAATISNAIAALKTIFTSRGMFMTPNALHNRAPARWRGGNPTADTLLGAPVHADVSLLLVQCSCL